MLVFADYDNIDVPTKRRGLEHIADRIVRAVSQLPIQPQPKIDVRLYGGWFVGPYLSKMGQDLSVEVSDIFPKVLSTPWNGKRERQPVIINFHIARSLTACEQVPLHHTFRRRAFGGKLHFSRRATTVCADEDCPLIVIEKFLSQQSCPTSGCMVKQIDVIERHEQKLVDTMLVSDLIYWAGRQNHPLLAVLSSDDDMWPGIRTSIALTRPIIQLHTERSRQHSNYSVNLGQEAYIQTDL